MLRRNDTAPGGHPDYHEAVEDLVQLTRSDEITDHLDLLIGSLLHEEQRTGGLPVSDTWSIVAALKVLVKRLEHQYELWEAEQDWD